MPKPFCFAAASSFSRNPRVGRFRSFASCAISRSGRARFASSTRERTTEMIWSRVVGTDDESILKEADLRLGTRSASSQFPCHFLWRPCSLWSFPPKENLPMKPRLLLATVFALIFSATLLIATQLRVAAANMGTTISQQDSTKSPASPSVTFDESNPFAKPSPLPFHAPPFDKIKDTDYQPALEEGMRRELAEMEKIANDPAPPTFANTIEAMERAGELLDRV